MDGSVIYKKGMVNDSQVEREIIGSILDMLNFKSLSRGIDHVHIKLVEKVWAKDTLDIRESLESRR